MDLYYILQQKVPNFNPLTDAIIECDGSGGQWIGHWYRDDLEPTSDIIQSWSSELAQEYLSYRKNLLNQPIIKQLEDLDNKSIRALRANDADKLAELEAEAATLRAQLLK